MASTVVTDRTRRDSLASVASPSRRDSFVTMTYSPPAARPVPPPHAPSSSSVRPMRAIRETVAEVYPYNSPVDDEVVNTGYGREEESHVFFGPESSSTAGLLGGGDLGQQQQQQQDSFKAYRTSPRRNSRQGYSQVGTSPFGSGYSSGYPSSELYLDEGSMQKGYFP
jgi:hypothetical protein